MIDRELTESEASIEPIAIIGMACRVPGADGLDAFWENLVGGVESIRELTDEQMLAAGAGPNRIRTPGYVRRAPVLDGIEEFDAGRFGFSRREAEILDPQHRLLLECAASALDHAGYDPARYAGDIGVYAGAGAGEYQWYHLVPNKPLLNAVGQMAVALANNPDYISTLLSYKLNLRGPSISVHTACSTGLVAVHLACEAVRNGECDMALAGAASIELTQEQGYQYHEGGILSPDGHCRTFDADAQGTLWGSGGGMVVLKRLSDALADGDFVHAVILGSAINNDGADKVGFSAPSVSGQAEVISQALGVAGVDPSTIDYIEAHGTATSIGDPIEVSALTEVFRRSTDQRNFCGLGSVKPNIGHLAAAAGVIGLIKTVLSLEHETLPQTLHYKHANPKIDFDTSPFRVVATNEAWPRRDTPRRAGVSSFGMGGTNAHVVVEEAAPRAGTDAAPGPHALVLSARTPSALDVAAAELAEHLRRHPNADLGEVAYTLQHGRRAAEYRRAVVCADTEDAAQVLSGGAPRRVIAGRARGERQTVFMLPGQGAQRLGMTQALYAGEPVVRDAIDRCAELLRPELGLDLRDVLFGEGEEAAARLDDTTITQPALFTVEYALAQLWMARGVTPDALIGHSLGEYVAACLAGVFSLETALRLVAARAGLMGACAPGTMLAVQYDEEGLGDLAGRGLSLAAVNGPSACVVSGPADAIETYAAELDDAGIPNTRLSASHAFHSTMMEPARAGFAALLAEADLRTPAIPILSNVTAEWLTPEQATSPAYWTSHMCLPVRFGEGLRNVMAEAPSVLLEVGPGAVLSGIARLQLTPETPDPVVTLPRNEPEAAAVLAATARLWTLGLHVDWNAGDGRRTPLPGQPFERERYWIEELPPAPPSGPVIREDKLPPEEWFWMPGWRQTPRPEPAPETAGPWLVFRDGEGVADELVERLRAGGEHVVTVTAGDRLRRLDPYAHVIRAAEPSDYDALLEALAAEEAVPARIVHAWALRREMALSFDVAAAERAVQSGFGSLLSLAQALAARGLAEDRRLYVVTADSQDVTGGDLTSPAQATVTGPCRVFPLEFPSLECRHVDVALAAPGASVTAAAEALATEVRAGGDPVVAYRAGKRWVPTLEATPLTADAAGRAELRPGGVYVITGGLGGIGLSVAEALARRVGARLVLLGRSPMPPRDAWDELAKGSDRVSRRVQRLLALEALGAELLVLDADVTSVADMERVRDAAVSRFGAVHGVVHAAGVAGGTLVEAHSPGTAEEVLAPKVAGSLVLARVFDDTALDFLVLCSSVTAVAGALGQVDYCAGNAFMDAFAHARAAAGAPVVSVNWGGWLEVGMAVETDAPAGFRDIQRGLRPIAVDHPLLDTVVESEDARTVTATATLGPATHWALDEHRIHGTAVLPGTGYLEMVRATFDHDGDGRPVVLRDVVFLAPLAVPDGERKEARVVIEYGDDGAEFRVESRTGDRWVMHARGGVGWGEGDAAPTHDLEAIRGRCPRRRDDAGVQSSASGMLTFGPRWSSLKRATAGDREELALLEAGPDVAAEVSRFGLHPALLDEATAFGEFDSAEGRYLPLGYGRLEVRAPLPPRLYSHLRHRDGGSKGVLLCDISLLDDSGTEVAEIREFMLRRVDPRSLDVANPEEAAAPPPPAVDVDDVGIRPHEGADALLRVLGARPAPQVVVSALDMPTLIASVAKVTRDRLEDEVQSTGGGVDLELLDGEYVEPTTDLERKLVALWEEATGTRGIGIEHDFFEIGGNSLVAVQLMSRVRTTFGVKLPMRSLFEAPTIAAMAAAIAAGMELAA